MSSKRCTQPKGNIFLIVIHIFFICLALGAGLVALFTDEWITYEVTPDPKSSVYNASVDSSMLYHTRSRGLFWFVVKDPNVKLVRNRGDDPRFPVQYNHNNTCNIKVSAGFWDLSVMMKASVSLHLVYLIILGLCAWLSCFALIFGILNLKLAVIVMVLGEVAGIIGMALFHVYLAFERSNDVPEAADTAYYYWNTFLKDNTKEFFSYSFMLQWISIGITFITIILGAMFIAIWKTHKRSTKQPPPINYNNAHDNYAYDKEDYRTVQRPVDYRPSPMVERRDPVPEHRDQAPLRRSWSANDFDDQPRRRPQEDTRYDYREIQRDERYDRSNRDERPPSRQQYPQQSDPNFYPRY